MSKFCREYKNYINPEIYKDDNPDAYNDSVSKKQIIGVNKYKES